ncbi:MAG: O-methyltransferase [Solirubrobacterales bacterium]
MRPADNDHTDGDPDHRSSVLTRARGSASVRARSATAGVLHSSAGVRLGMAASLARLAPRRDATFQALARTARTIAFDRIPPDEQRWAERIEARKRELQSREGSARPFEETLPTAVAQASTVASIPAVWGLFLMRLVRELRPQSCLELGTGIGISTGYEAAALKMNGGGRLITLDGSPEWAAIAEEGISSLGLEGVEFAVGPISDSLPGVLERLAPVDYALVDAEHTEEATIGYFEGIVPHMAPQGVMVFDDIPWTRELWRTWKRIVHDPRVAAGFALGRMGTVVVA